MCKVLHPQMKMRHFKEHWTADLQVDVREVVEEAIGSFYIFLQNFQLVIIIVQFKQCYEKLNKNLAVPVKAKKGWRSASNMTKLLRELESSDSDESSDDSGPSTHVDPTKPWIKEFNQYLNATDELLDGQMIV